MQRPTAGSRAKLGTAILLAGLVLATTVAVAGASARTTPAPQLVANNVCVAPGCSIALSTASGSHGNLVTVTMTNYYPNDFGMVWFWNGVVGRAAALVASGPTGTTGDFALKFHVPVDPAGAYVVYVTDYTGDNQSAAFALTKLVASPNSGMVSANSMVTGDGFPANAKIRFRIDGVSAPTVAPCSASSSGAFSCIIYVPNISAGTYHLVAIGGGDFGRVVFTVT